MLRGYKVLNKQCYEDGRYSIVPLRPEDRYEIMKWRNEQIYHLRQTQPLTVKDQDHYFSEVVANLFSQDLPSQILFSYLEDGKCIGYGGLVHINWNDQNAEISFIIDTKLEKEHFRKHWNIYLGLLEQVAFGELNLHKIYTYAFDLRPQLYQALEGASFIREATLKEHAIFEGDFVDVVIHSKCQEIVRLREVEYIDLNLTFKWATDSVIRKYALSQHEISFEEHKKWFLGKLQDDKCLFFIAEKSSNPIGSIRFDISESGEATISYLVDSQYHGLGYGKTILKKGLSKLNRSKKSNSVVGIVKKINKASSAIFQKLGFKLLEENEEVLVFKIDQNKYFL